MAQYKGLNFKPVWHIWAGETNWTPRRFDRLTFLSERNEESKEIMRQGHKIVKGLQILDPTLRIVEIYVENLMYRLRGIPGRKSFYNR